MKKIHLLSCSIALSMSIESMNNQGAMLETFFESTSRRVTIPQDTIKIFENYSNEVPRSISEEEKQRHKTVVKEIVTQDWVKIEKAGKL